MAETTAPQATKTVKISEIQELLKDGKTRKEIAAIYGTSQAAMSRVFQHEKLKGLRTHAGLPFNLEDDTPAEEPKAPKAKAAKKAAASADGTSPDTGATAAVAQPAESATAPVAEGQKKEGLW